jgi:hypothetical protein
VVRGLDVFRSWFSSHADEFVLIGGTAATLALEEAGLEFRATKDLDIVLHVEALTPRFGEVFGGSSMRVATRPVRPPTRAGRSSIDSRSRPTRAFR